MFVDRLESIKRPIQRVLVLDKSTATSSGRIYGARRSGRGLAFAMVSRSSRGEGLQHFVEHKVIPKVLKNPGKRIQISKYRDITVEEKNPS